MLTRKFITIYGFVGIAVMAVLLILIWFKLVPQSYYLPLFIFALVIWMSRLVLRFFMVKKEERDTLADGEKPDL